MRMPTVLLALSCVLFVSASVGSAAFADGRPDYTQLDGVPLDGSEDAVLTVFEQIKSATATPSPAPTQRASLFGNGQCVGALQCAIMGQNPNRSTAAQRFAASNERIMNEGLSPIEIRAKPFNPQHTPCTRLPGDNKSETTFDTSLLAEDRKRVVIAKFIETTPDQPCVSSATQLITSQATAATTVEAIDTVEDEFVKAANQKFGTPTLFMPRHIGDVVNNHSGENMLGTFNNIIGAGNNAPQAPTVEKRTIAPIAIWCDTGTQSDCKTGGSSVNHKLTLDFGAGGGYVEANVRLEDLQAERRIKAAITKSDVQNVKPQL